MRVDLSRRFNSGLCKERIYIRQQSEGVPTSYGEPSVTWTVFQEARARITPLQGTELERVQQTWANARFKVETPYIAGVKRKMQIVWGDLDGSDPASTARVLDVLDAEDPYQNRLQLWIYCKEWVE
jgi:head-tail adaptor